MNHGSMRNTVETVAADKKFDKETPEEDSADQVIIDVPPKQESVEDLARRYFIKAVALVVITLCTCGTNLLIQLSKSSQTENGAAHFSYNPTTVVLFSEFFKLIISFLLALKGYMFVELFITFPSRGDIPNLKEFWNNHILSPDLPKFSVPAILYMIQNNLQFYTMIFVNATAYLIFNQLKILATGVAFRLIFNKHLTWLQWVSLLLLTLGTLVSQLSTKETETFTVSLYGFILSMIMVTLSAVSGVSNEFLMKKVGRGEAESIHIQNMKLYLFGCIANTLFLMKSGTLSEVFKGFNFLTFVILCTASINGLAVSAVVKYADTLVKTFATSIAMVSTSVLSVFLFNAKMTLTIPIGILIIFCALFSYNYEATFLHPQAAVGKK